MRATIQERKEIAKGTIEVTFALDQKAQFLAGQYAFVTLQNPPFSDTRGNRRHFSISNSPHKNNCIIIATRIGKSAFKRSLRKIPIGTAVEIGPIAGAFTLPNTPNRPLVFLVGGIGITPFMSMLRFVDEEKRDDYISLFYANKECASAAYFSELQEKTKTIKHFQFIPTFTQDPTWEGEKRRIDASFVKQYIKDVQKPLYYIVGSVVMVSAMYEVVTSFGVLPEQIKRENFTGY
ncbi:MAG: FAD-dependent oxidoreductase [Candidatus Levybacteria bacterium]|nr:FAD-dependent oxidoreductase [Candidatus Levybacteria bacterium]